MTDNIGTMIDNMISWAQSRIGNENYAGWVPVTRVLARKVPEA